MKKIGIFFGSDTGNTEKIANLIFKLIGSEHAKLYDISNVSKKEIEFYNILIFGIPTWYYGELQCDWDDFLPILKKIDFNKKIVAIFGCGDQEDYSEYFCDAMNEIHTIVRQNGANTIGKWSSKGYFFEKSKALVDKKHFLGLVIDEDRQKKLSHDRVKQWTSQILKEIKHTV